MPPRSRVLHCFLAAATFAALAAPLAAHAAPGDLDTTYGTGGRVIESLGTSVAAVIPVGDGTALVAGTYTDPSSGISTMWASRRTVTGAPDATFGGANDSWAIVSFATLSCNSVTGTDAVRTSDGALLIAGTCTRGGDQHMAVARLTPAGVPDPGFGTNGRVLLEFSDDPTDLSSEANAIALTHDGAHALVGGQASTSYAASGDASVRSMALVQIDAVTGAVASLTGQDRRTYPFAGVGSAKRPSRIEDLVVNSDGTIAATGQVEQPFARGVLRLLGGGDYDPRFGGEAPLSVGQATYGYGTSDYAQGIAVLPNGSMVVAGSTESRPRLSVVIPSGATHFAEAASTTPGASTAVELDDSGRQYVTGWRFEGGMRAFVERRSADGSLAFDASFGGAGRVDVGFPGAAVGTALALDGNRGLLVGGFTIDDQNRQTAVLARLLTADATVAPDPQTPVTPPTTSPPPPIQRVVTDTVAPIVTVTDPVGGSVRRSGEWNFAGAADPTGTPLVRVYLYRSGAATAMAELPTSTGSSTRWSIAGPHGQVLADGTYELEAVQVDAAGNVGRSGRVKFRVDLPRKKPTNPSTMKVVGRFAVDQVIGVTSSSPWSPATGVSLSYRWERCRSAASVTCAAIPGSFARSATYQLEAADAARWVRVLVTARTEAGATVKTSATAGPITAEPRPPRLASGHPVIEGRAAVGQTLTARTGTWTGIPAPNVSVSWQRCTYFGVCRQVSTGGSYRIQEQDTGHRLQATVTAVNTAAWNSVTTAGTAFVEASPLDDRHDRIIASYRQAFGDSPTSAEVAYWLTRGNLSVQQLVEFHRQGLRTDRTLASRAMRNAYVQAYGHAPNDNQARVGQTTRDVDAIMRTGQTYDELVPVLGRRLAQQAFDKVYFWDPSLRRG
ncbi:MAG: hypothetical protein JWM98_3414, partial [Thermoleophilia bacterium]|nr:hypothetical protein [Thermoleophilia bacterium]